jgi:hypothetical protein
MADPIIDRKNIDRNKTTLKEGRDRFVSNSLDTYCCPEIIIIKNEIGKDLFNMLATTLLGDYKEKGLRIIGDVTYPYYVLTMDWITSGCHFGVWEYFDHIPDDLIDTEKMESDFEGFRLWLQTLFIV